MLYDSHEGSTSLCIKRWESQLRSPWLAALKNFLQRDWFQEHPLPCLPHHSPTSHVMIYKHCATARCSRISDPWWEEWEATALPASSAWWCLPTMNGRLMSGEKPKQGLQFDSLAEEEVFGPALLPYVLLIQQDSGTTICNRCQEVFIKIAHQLHSNECVILTWPSSPLRWECQTCLAHSISIRVWSLRNCTSYLITASWRRRTGSFSARLCILLKDVIRSCTKVMEDSLPFVDALCTIKMHQ